MNDQPDSQQNAPRKIVQGFAQALIQSMPLAGSGSLLISFLSKQEWLMAIITFPVMMVTVAWAAYTKSFLEQLEEEYKKRAKEDAKRWMVLQESLIQALGNTIRWQVAKTEAKYLRCSGSDSREFRTEGFRSGAFVPLLSEVFVPLELSSAFR